MHLAADSEHSAEDPTTDSTADAATIKDSLFRFHPPFSQPSKEDYEQHSCSHTCTTLIHFWKGKLRYDIF